MTTRRTFAASLLTVAALPVVAAAQTCCSKEKAPAPAKEAGAKLKATNAEIVETNGAKTKIKITCGKCGMKAAAIEIDTPTADKPYTQEWTCSKCGFKQKVTVEVATA